MNPLFTGHSLKMRLWLTAISLLLLTACQGTPIHKAYEGQPRSASEVATFIIPEKFNLLAMDGAKYSRASLKDGVVIEILPGSHEFLIEYQDFWDLGGDDHEKVTSKPIAFKFTAQASKQYTINSKVLEDVEQAQIFAKKPAIAIIDKSSKQSVSAEIKYNRYTGSFLGSLFGSSESTGSQPALAMPASSKPSTKSDGKALEMLKYWWETANKEQRDNFQKWLEE